MPRFRAWGLAAAVAAGFASPAARADDSLKPARSSAPPTTVYNKLFGPSKPKAGPVARGTSPASRVPAAVAPLPPDVVAAALRSEQDAWERRMSVCLKLRQVAMDANDESLMRQVDELERQATSLYNARAAALGVSKLRPTSEAPAERGDPEAMKVAARRLTAPAAPTAFDPAVRTAEARTPTDVIREVRP